MSASFEQLDALSSQELHERAFKQAREQRDAGFFWHLLEAIPEARTAASGARDGAADVEHVFTTWLGDFVRGGGKLDEGLRPFFIEYLQQEQ